MRKTSLSLLIVALVTAVGWWGIRAVGETKRRHLIDSHQATVAARQLDWAAARSARELAARREAVARARGHLDELQAAMGGPVAAAAYNPELGIGESIKQVALACAPLGTTVRVQVDRFTEFTALLQLPSPVDGAALAKLARCVLNHHSRFIHRLQFSHGQTLLAVLDRRGIESISDWSYPSLAAVQQLLDTEFSGHSLARTEVPESPETAEDEIQNRTPEARRQFEAQETFQAAMKTAHEQLASVFETAQLGTELGDVHQRTELQARKQLIQEAATLATQARAVLADPAAQYRHLLSQARLDEVYVRSAVRTVEQHFQPQRAAVHQLFDRLSTSLRSSAALLDALIVHFGEWSYDPAQRQFLFNSPPAHRDIGRALEQTEHDSRALQAATAEWARIGGVVKAADSRK